VQSGRSGINLNASAYLPEGYYRGGSWRGRVESVLSKGLALSVGDTLEKFETDEAPFLATPGKSLLTT
jgi:hypothetical protein